MKIVFLLHAASTVLKGGSEIQADLIINEMLERGHDVYYISDLIRTPMAGREGVKYLYLKSFGRRFSYLNLIPLIRMLRNIEPDVIYQRYRIPYTGIGSLYAKKYSKKMIFNAATNKDVVKNKISFNHMVLPNLIKEYIGRYGIRKTDLIIVQTFHQQMLLKENFGRDSIVIPNGHPVPLPPFRKTSPLIVIWVANIKQWKQPEIFIRLAKEFKKTDVQFIYVGRPAKGIYQEMLMNISKKLPGLKYLGEISHEETNELLSKSSILVNTSLKFEGFPNTYIQAWMRQIPVITLNFDPDDIIKKNKIGFHSGSFKQMVRDVRYLIENDNVRDEMGKRARQYSIENHDIKKIAKKYLDIFRELVDVK